MREKLSKIWQNINKASGKEKYSLLLIFIFLYWFTKVLLPVLFLELKYQYQKFLQEKFQADNLKGVFIPDFSVLSPENRSKHQDFGIKIPSIFLDEPVVINVNPNDKSDYSQALKKGIAHARGTALPGDTGIGYYFAHSSSAALRSQYNAVFYLLGKVEAGDAIYLWFENTRYRYVVFDKKITPPQDVSFLQKTDDEIIVLQTCWPPGTSSQRLLVFAQREEKTEN